MTDGTLFKVNNCNVVKINNFNKNNYKLYESFNKIYNLNNKIIDIRIGDEMEFYIKLKSNDFITIFLEIDFDTSENFQILDIYHNDEINSDFIESFNESSIKIIKQ